MDDEKLILLVRERSVLYDKYNPHFKLVNKKMKAWLEIANEMETTAEDCMRRWTCIRDRFTRECKRLERSGDKDYVVPWPYFEMMDFIRSHVTPRPFRQSSFSRLNKKLSFDKKQSPQPSLAPKLSAPPSPMPSTSVSPASPMECGQFAKIFDDPLTETPLPHKKTIDSSYDVDKSFCDAVQTLKQVCALNEARHANPAVYAFGEMIVSTICKMNSRNQLKAMQQVTDIVMKIKLEEDELLEQAP